MPRNGVLFRAVRVRSAPTPLETELASPPVARPGTPPAWVLALTRTGV